MKIHELYTNLLEEALDEDTKRITAHSHWMAELIINLPRDPAFKKLNASMREEIQQIITAIE